MATLGEAPELESATAPPNIPSVTVGQIYSHMVTDSHYLTPFSPEESTGDTDSIWTLFLHIGVYVMAIGLLIPAGLGTFCSYFF